MYKAKIEKYREKLFDYDNKYSEACATIWLNYEESPYVHIKGIENLLEI